LSEAARLLIRGVGVGGDAMLPHRCRQDGRTPPLIEGPIHTRSVSAACAIASGLDVVGHGLTEPLKICNS
jgi:hypothetical protein